MTDRELREMVRESIARHTGRDTVLKTDAPYEDACSSHPSFVRLPLVRGDEEGHCLIEPAVRCNHCGYCLSYGH